MIRSLLLRTFSLAGILAFVLAAGLAPAHAYKDARSPRDLTASYGAANARGNDSLLTIQRVAPESLVDRGLNMSGRTHAPIPSLNSSNHAVDLPRDAKAPVRIGTPSEAGIGLHLPFADVAEADVDQGSGLVEFDNKNGSATVPVAKNDGSVQIMTVIENSLAPESYSYTLDLPSSARLESQKGGGVAILGISGEFLGGVAPPWAKDSNGVAIPTRYVIQGTSLTQIVDHRNSAGVAYPVVADPWLGVDLMYTPYVTFHSSGYAVNVQATLWGRQFNGLPTHFAHVDELKTKLGGNAWRVTYSIEQQFLCHVAGNIAELGTYNMESWRPGLAWAVQLSPSIRCNP